MSQLVRVIWTFLLVLWGGLFDSYGQEVLAAGTIKSNEIVYFEGDIIDFKTWEEDIRKDDVIRQLHPTYMVLSFDTVAYHEVKAVYLPDGPKIPRMSALLMQLGFSYWAIDTFNQVLVQGNSFKWDDDVLKISGVAIGAGLLLTPLKRKKVKFGRRNQLRLIDTYDLK